MNEGEFSDEEDDALEDLPLDESASAFAILENEYKTLLAKLQENEELTEFADGYTKLFEALYQTHNHEQELITKTVDNETEIKNTQVELDMFRKQAHDDAATIEDLQKELVKSRDLTDKAHAREQQTQEFVENMRSQMARLNADLEQKAALTTDDDDAGALNKTKETFEREKQKMLDEIVMLKQRLDNIQSYSAELEQKNSLADLKTAELNGLLEQNKSESSKKQRLIEKLESDIKTINANVQNLQNELASAKMKYNKAGKNISTLEEQLKKVRTECSAAKQREEITEIKLEKLSDDYDELHSAFVEFRKKHDETNKLLKLKTDENSKLVNDLTKLDKQRENCEKKILVLEKMKATVEQEREKLRATIHLLEREVNITKKQAENDQKQVNALIKEKDILHKNTVRLQGVIEEHLKLIKIQEQTKRKLEIDLHSLRADINDQKMTMIKLEKDKVRAVHETLELTKQVEDAMDEGKLKQQSIYECKKTIAEMETKLRQQQHLFEAVRADRNSFQKQLQEITAEVAELKSKLKISLHQCEQLKEDIVSKEALLLKDENTLAKVNKDRENLKVELQKELNIIQQLKSEIAEYQQSEKRLLKLNQEYKTGIKNVSNELEQSIHDRDLIGAQLVRRNDEIGLLYEKIKILEITLTRGETHYEQRIDDIRLLKLEVKKLRQEKNALTKTITNMTDLKQEVFTLERELAQERLKCRALEEEMQHPLNFHRWRKLEGTNPEMMDLLQKIQILQKRLLNQTSEAIERERQLKESEKLYTNLQQILARQPGPDVKNELIKTQRALTLRGTKMKFLVSEINMYETQAMEYKIDIEKLTKELKDIKKKYYKEKKYNQRHLAGETKLPAIKTSEEDSQLKFTGGGFKMLP
ncbi:uncharacterized protein CBL_00919 [Carabus blaptoides fortunei]